VRPPIRSGTLGGQNSTSEDPHACGGNPWGNGSAAWCDELEPHTGKGAGSQERRPALGGVHVMPSGLISKSSHAASRKPGRNGGADSGRAEIHSAGAAGDLVRLRHGAGKACGKLAAVCAGRPAHAGGPSSSAAHSRSFCRRGLLAVTTVFERVNGTLITPRRSREVAGADKIAIGEPVPPKPLVLL